MFDLLYDGEWLDRHDSLEGALGHITAQEASWEEDKEENPEYYSESDEFPFELYEISQVVLKGNEIKDLVKNMS